MRIPRVLYKFKSFNVNSLKQIERIDVYYADPRSFNDPLDCNPTIDGCRSIREAENVLIDFYESNSKNGALAGQQRIEEIKYDFTNPEYDSLKKSKKDRRYKEAVLREVRLEIGKLFGTTGVLSLSSAWDEVLMWSHYGSNHSGICIGYRTKENRCKSLKPVDYTLPRAIPFELIREWRFNNSTDAEEKMRNQYFYAKASSWSYEKEWRDLSSPRRSGKSGVGEYGSPFDICEFIFGMHCDNSVITSVMRIHESNRNKIKYYQMFTSGRSFTLKRRSLDPDEMLSGSPGISVVTAMRMFDRASRDDV